MFEAIIPSFLITFREALEAALIVAIMVTYLRKIGKGSLSRFAYVGSGLAIMLSLFLGAFIIVFYGGLSDVASQLFEGFASLAAVGVLTYMIFWMTEHSKEVTGDLQSKIDVRISRGELYGIASLAFVAVLREGLETVLFLSTTFFQDASGTLIGIAAGSIVVLFLAIILMRSTRQLDIKKFFSYSSILLIVFSAGLAGYGVHELIEAGEGMGYDFGWLGDKPFDINPSVNPDGSYPLLHEKGFVGSIMKALVGYDGNPEWLRIIVYVAYWCVIGYYVYQSNKTPKIMRVSHQIIS
jgi:high-affinity iron transporter